MHRRKLLWQLYPSFLIIMLVATVAVVAYTLHSVQRFYLAEVKSDLQIRAQLIEQRLPADLSERNAKAIDELCDSVAQAGAARITVIANSGTVIADTESDVAAMDNHLDRPEIHQALTGPVGSSERFSYTLNKHIVYVAIPVVRQGHTVAVLRLAVPSRLLDEAVGWLGERLLIGAIIVMIFAAIAAFLAARPLAKTLGEMQKLAHKFSEGDLHQRLPIPDSQEFAELATTMNHMAEHLSDRLTTIEQQRNQQLAMLSSMVEGVLAVDVQQKIIAINNGACRLLGVAAESAQGRALCDVVRNADLQTFVDRVMSTAETQEGELSLHDTTDVFLQAHGTALRDANGQRIGAVIVLNDMTRLRRLENVRRDFVANVSHELKTPVTSIKGFVETLLDGAVNDPESAKRFLGIIAKQADRLNSIIEDLLMLSRLEQSGRQEELSLKVTPLAGVLKDAADVCQLAAREKNTTVDISCSAEVKAAINMPLFEQAISNLIDNAIKYGEAGKTVRVTAEADAMGVRVRVADEGCGIEKEHLSRVFERFYRVDKARSRKLGGTGLGLAIVKHIVQAHGGDVSVQSQVGVGTTFTIVLPSVDVTQ